MANSLTNDLQGKVVNFSTYRGTKELNMKFTGSVDYSVATALGLDVPAAHRANYPHMPTGTADDYRLYQYAIFESPTGDRVIEGVPWVDAKTIEVVTRPVYNIVVASATPKQMENIKSMLISMGLEDFEIVPR